LEPTELNYDEYIYYRNELVQANNELQLMLE
jgi:hypothetical protein